MNKRLPDSFQFSQASLQDFVDCRRRFQLRYLWQLSWPALQAEPAHENEDALHKGQTFHKMVYQHLSGVSASQVERLIMDPDLERWWENYLGHSLWKPDKVTLFPEISISASLHSYRLVAKYDLISIDANGMMTIVDWKTSRNRQKRDWLSDRMQTYIYPNLLVRAGCSLNAGEPVLPDMIQMVYWFAEFPGQEERFIYSENKYRKDEQFIQQQLELIHRLIASRVDFPLTSQELRCRFCIYRSLCNRGTEAGSFENFEGSIDAGEFSELSIDFDQIVEIEF